MVRVLSEKGTYFHCTDSVEPWGIQGELPPYHISRDPLITVTLLGLFFLLCMLWGRSRSLLILQLKNTFLPRHRSEQPNEAGNDHLSLPLYLLNSIVTLAVLVYHLKLTTLPLFPFMPGYLLLGATALAITAYGMVKMCLYLAVDWVFLDGINNYKHHQAILWIFTFEGLSLYPLICLSIYADFSPSLTLLAASFVIIFCKMIQFYKGVKIFFSNFFGLLLNILYFCTLELIPLLIIVKVVVDIN